MIESKSELQYYLECDKISLRKSSKKPRFFGDEIWKFQIYMRKLDFYKNRGGYSIGTTVLSTINFQ